MSAEGGTPDKITPGGPFQSFITAVRARDPELCNAGPEHGHFSAGRCHLSNIVHRVGEPAPLAERPKHQLGDDPVAGKFTGGGEVVAKANGLQTRDYREPWVVPEAV